MVATKIFAELKSLLFIKRVWWRHKARNLIATPTEPKLRALAEEEKAAVDELTNGLFERNLAAFLREMTEKKLLSDIMIAGYGYEAVNDMFLRGMLLECLENRPPLPTDSVRRANLYAIAFFTKSQGMTFLDARERVNRTEALYNQASELFDAILETGRAAYRDGGDQHLIDCHAAAVRERIPQRSSENPDEEPRPASALSPQKEPSKLVDITATQVEALSNFLVDRVALLAAGGLYVVEGEQVTNPGNAFIVESGMILVALRDVAFGNAMWEEGLDRLKRL
jgi:hypothetical protein